MKLVLFVKAILYKCIFGPCISMYRLAWPPKGIVFTIYYNVLLKISIILNQTW